MTDIAFRQIRVKDLPLVLNLLKEAAEKINRMQIDHWQYWKNPPQEKVRWIEEGIKNGEFYFVDDLANNNIGMVRMLREDILYWGKQKDKAFYVHSLIVKEAYNGKGIGQRVLEEIGQKAKNKDCQYLRLDSDSKNLKLCKYYENLGFRKVGVKNLPLSTYNLYQKRIL
ncbi:GNAT family N-acetyltransferase [Cyclobacterium marinum]|uniref:GCN5-related N-acetyltransferase n=1 Tax=Cyclobacterium marinum (strain ATCC 25205 / DSM 745 / LMG 13164 / NCIMB 1802) TaxID=880070 RepID=G0J5Q9_CYCMS|nr:GNAT family N-acetyltransferase [Cyclobacterium marinum]AEL25360.1 GCN5-related N-acetyltransferase [Cyclobacterium marinum DSM 745]MBI0400799.1 GNAT family N-acetyltransferase [Cyclobacterium marinum]MBR9774135.1 GNAT family N-acetyltransferase [Cytophagales bacterium]|tara:strand:+ start:1975 stop:2481 length:507 start_codon:yes stop_codon:yes gene_type:complete